MIHNYSNWNEVYVEKNIITSKTSNHPFSGTIKFDSHSQKTTYVDITKGLVDGLVKIVTKFNDNSNKKTLTRSTFGIVKNGDENGKLKTIDHNGDTISKSDFRVTVDDYGIYIEECGIKEYFNGEGKLYKTDTLLENESKTTYYFEDGSIQMEDLFYGNLNSKRVHYFRNGNVESITELKDDKYEGHHTSFYQSGQKKEEGIYINDLKNGVWSTFYSNGNRKMIETYKGNLLHGSVTHFNENERIVKNEIYNYGKKHGTHFEKDNNGEMVEVIYKNGKLLGKNNYINRYRFKHSSIFE